MSKVFIGTVTSTKMDKTIVVSIERTHQHSLYRKVITNTKKFKVHCEDKNIQEGDRVSFKEVKPISKDKHFMFISKVDIKGKEIKSEPVAAKSEVAAEKPKVTRAKKTTKAKVK